ncbi:squalene synthetase [Aulographum hederae CBS 113979]|uniref:Squalene synthase n=1 Tax=Aulographum hederae CBS 113979 TaxID=1176131 RepID=A0A6G1HB90_9PEZI|nr:squalene synthetase [Aulographum hederae CBS 113979]
MKSSEILYYAVHPQELRAIVQWMVWHNPVHERNPEKESETLKQCFYYLDFTSRSFAAVIKELNPELLVPICVFYLVLRGLDTIEDDMSIQLSEKEPLLRNFDQSIEKEGWNYDGNGSREKDRELLVHFECVVAEFRNLKPVYREIIKDIAKKMGDGMADYCNNAEHNIHGVNSIKDYQLYCHYVAGLVGEGLTRLFVESKLANPALLERPELHESMGQFLQQINIIRDIKEDLDDKRRFWPKEVWSKYVDKFEDLCKPENKEIAMHCSSEMCAIALENVTDCLFYLAGIKDQSVFNFAAIPQAMAVATVELCFRNPDMFQRNVKITKGQACQLMMESTQNLQVLCDTFKRYVRKIHKKNDPRDPSFLKISIACGKIEQFIESIFPTQKPKEITGKPVLDEKAKAEKDEAYWDGIYMAAAAGGALLFVTFFMFFIAWMAGARFDLAFSSMKDTLFPSGKGSGQLTNPEHKEL